MRSRWMVLLSSVLLGCSACGATASSGVRAGDAAPAAVKTATPADTSPDTTSPDDTVPSDSTPSDSTAPDSSGPDTAPTDSTPDSRPTTGGTIPSSGPRFSFPNDKPAQPYDSFLEKAINDIQDFWRFEYPKVYSGRFTELAGGVFAAYPGVKTGPTGCELTESSYDKIRQFKAFYCGEGDFIAYDDGDLFPTLDKEIGRFSLAMALSHEFGHAVQDRAGVRGPTILLEQQADCFAGAWVRHVADGGASGISFNDDDLNVSLTGLVAFRDQPGVQSNNPQAHGSAFDRVGAFQEGWTGGLTRCKSFATNPPTTIQLPFTTGDFQTQGNAPYDGLVDVLHKGLDDGWKTLLGSQATGFTSPTIDVGDDNTSNRCRTVPKGALRVAFYCAPTNTIVASDKRLRQLYQQFGDNAVGMVLAESYADAVQHSLGSTLTGERRALASDCLSGAWTASLFPDPGVAKDVTISAGDLDEAIQTLIAIGDPTQDTNLRGSPFEKIGAFRKGVLDGLDACRAQLKA